MDESRVKRLVPPAGGSGILPPPARREEDRVWVQISRKIRLGQYEMLELGCGATVSTLPGETVAEALKRVEADVRREHAELMEALREDSGV